MPLPKSPAAARREAGWAARRRPAARADGTTRWRGRRRTRRRRNGSPSVGGEHRPCGGRSRSRARPRARAAGGGSTVRRTSLGRHDPQRPGAHHLVPSGVGIAPSSSCTRRPGRPLRADVEIPERNRTQELVGDARDHQLGAVERLERAHDQRGRGAAVLGRDPRDRAPTRSPEARHRYKTPSRSRHTGTPIARLHSQA